MTLSSSFFFLIITGDNEMEPTSYFLHDPIFPCKV